ncbi:MAG: hypothetical protein JWN18_624 [Parcubacteria group bacterium]|nr:hypothetical protein [Parcubacteria group bacterium]
MSRNSIGIILSLLAVVLLALVVIHNGVGSSGQQVYSPTQVLSATWYSYKKNYISPDYRTLDTQRSNITTSEGQSYTMLRAVWQGDQTTFDGAWAWTRKNLGRTADHLFSWLWGTRSNGSTGVLLEQSGENSASDADTDIALALLFAYARWQDPQYLEEARLIISDIWELEVVTINGVPYLAADDIEKNAKTHIVVNPSYFNPAAYHLFAQVDKAHSWESVRKSSYDLLSKSMAAPLGGSTSAGLPPDWIQVDIRSGMLSPLVSTDHQSTFGYDALRVPLRVALDALWFDNPTAKALLNKFSFLTDEWMRSGRLASVYAHDGTVLSPNETIAMYGGTLGYFLANNPSVARQIYETKLISQFDPTSNSWAAPLSYYDDNMAWFGVALYNNQLPNLAAGLPSSAFSKSSPQ